MTLPKDWRSTISSILTAFFGFVLFSPEDFEQWPWVIHLSKYAFLGGLIALGVVSKDKWTHSTVAEVQEASMKEDTKASDAAKAEAHDKANREL